jgi:hypothetical protein
LQIAQIDPRAELEEYATEILEEQINLYQSYKTDKQRFRQAENAEGLDYWLCLQSQRDL